MNETLIELVKFTAIGLEDLIGNTQELEKAVKAAYDKQALLNRAMNDPAIRRAAAQIQTLRKATEDVARAEKQYEEIATRRGRLRSGAYLTDRARNHAVGSAHARLALGERAAAVTSGQYAREVADRERLRRKEAGVAAAERKTELQTLHGKTVGGALHGLERARPGLLAVGGIGGAGLAMAKSGLEGTVEGRALATEMKLLNRELAAAILPAVKDLTSVLRFVRHKLEKLTPGQQDVLGYGVMGAAGLGGLGLAANGISSALSGLGKIGGLVGLGGGGGAGVGQIAAETAAGSIAARGMAKKGRAVAQGSRFGRFARGAGRIAGKYGGPLALGYAAYEGVTGDYYAALRGKGNNKLVSGLGALGGGFADLLTFGSFSEHFGKKQENREAIDKFRKGQGGHRSPLIADAGFEDFDTAYQRTATAVALMDAQNAESNPAVAEQKKTNEKLDEINQTLKDQKEAKTPPLH